MTEMIKKINILFSSGIREKENATDEIKCKEQEKVSIEEVIRRYDNSYN